MIFPVDPFTSFHRKLIIALAARYRLPAIYGFRYFPSEGGLVSYGADRGELFRQAATYVHRILRGEKPADLPVQQPTKFELVINLKTAKVLGVTVARAALEAEIRVLRHQLNLLRRKSPKLSIAALSHTLPDWLNAVELDDWEVLCRDRNSYSLTITLEQTAHIELVSCRELLATSKMLSHKAGSKSKAKGCRIK